MSRGWKNRYTPDPLNIPIGQTPDIQYALTDPASIGSYSSGTVPLDSIVRGRSRIFFSPSSAGNYTISATSITEVDKSNLLGAITCSGAPVRLEARIFGCAAGTSAKLNLGFFWDGVAIESTGQFTLNTTNKVGVTFWTEVESPSPGTHTFSLAAYRATANGTIYSGAGNSIELVARET